MTPRVENTRGNTFENDRNDSAFLRSVSVSGLLLVSARPTAFLLLYVLLPAGSPRNSLQLRRLMIRSALKRFAVSLRGITLVFVTAKVTAAILVRDGPRVARARRRELRYVTRGGCRVDFPSRQRYRRFASLSCIRWSPRGGTGVGDVVGLPVRDAGTSVICRMRADAR